MGEIFYFLIATVVWRILCRAHGAAFGFDALAEAAAATALAFALSIELRRRRTRRASRPRTAHLVHGLLALVLALALPYLAPYLARARHLFDHSDAWRVLAWWALELILMIPAARLLLDARPQAGRGRELQTGQALVGIALGLALWPLVLQPLMGGSLALCCGTLGLLALGWRALSTGDVTEPRPDTGPRMQRLGLELPQVAGLGLGLALVGYLAWFDFLLPPDALSASLARCAIPLALLAGAATLGNLLGGERAPTWRGALTLALAGLALAANLTTLELCSEPAGWRACFAFLGLGKSAPGTLAWTYPLAVTLVTLGPGAFLLGAALRPIALAGTDSAATERLASVLRTLCLGAFLGALLLERLGPARCIQAAAAVLGLGAFATFAAERPRAWRLAVLAPIAILAPLFLWRLEPPLPIHSIQLPGDAEGLTLARRIGAPVATADGIFDRIQRGADPGREPLEHLRQGLVELTPRRGARRLERLALSFALGLAAGPSNVLYLGPIDAPQLDLLARAGTRLVVVSGFLPGSERIPPRYVPRSARGMRVVPIAAPSGLEAEFDLVYLPPLPLSHPGVATRWNAPYLRALASRAGEHGHAVFWCDPAAGGESARRELAGLLPGAALYTLMDLWMEQTPGRAPRDTASDYPGPLLGLVQTPAYGGATHAWSQHAALADLRAEEDPLPPFRHGRDLDDLRLAQRPQGLPWGALGPAPRHEGLFGRGGGASGRERAAWCAELGAWSEREGADRTALAALLRGYRAHFEAASAIELPIAFRFGRGEVQAFLAALEARPGSVFAHYLWSRYMPILRARQPGEAWRTIAAALEQLPHHRHFRAELTRAHLEALAPLDAAAHVDAVLAEGAATDLEHALVQALLERLEESAPARLEELRAELGRRHARLIEAERRDASETGEAHRRRALLCWCEWHLGRQERCRERLLVLSRIDLQLPRPLALACVRLLLRLGAFEDRPAFVDRALAPLSPAERIGWLEGVLRAELLVWQAADPGQREAWRQRCLRHAHLLAADSADQLEPLRYAVRSWIRLGGREPARAHLHTLERDLSAELEALPAQSPAHRAVHAQLDGVRALLAESE